MMAKVRPDPAAPVATVSVRVPETIYAQIRELALRHDVTLGQAFDLLLDKVRLDARRQVEEIQAELEELRKKYDAVKKERDECLRELDEVEKQIDKYFGSANSGSKTSKRKSKRDR